MGNDRGSKRRCFRMIEKCSGDEEVRCSGCYVFEQVYKIRY